MKHALVAIALIAAGCADATMRRPADLTPMQRPSPEQAEQAALDYLGQTLKDPGSLQQFRVTTVYSREYQATRFDPWHAGWVVCFVYNAKNSYGGYGGLTKGAIMVKLDGVNDAPRVDDVVPAGLLSNWCP